MAQWHRIKETLVLFKLTIPLQIKLFPLRALPFYPLQITDNSGQFVLQTLTLTRDSVPGHLQLVNLTFQHLQLFTQLDSEITLEIQQCS